LAEIISTEWAARDVDASVLKGATLISGIFDPLPTMSTTVNEQVRLSEEIARRRNVENRTPLVRCPVALIPGRRSRSSGSTSLSATTIICVDTACSPSCMSWKDRTISGYSRTIWTAKAPQFEQFNVTRVLTNVRGDGFSCREEFMLESMIPLSIDADSDAFRGVPRAAAEPLRAKIKRLRRGVAISREGLLKPGEIYAVGAWYSVQRLMGLQRPGPSST
jgi:hypothetical protein